MPNSNNPLAPIIETLDWVDLNGDGIFTPFELIEKTDFAPGETVYFQVSNVEVGSTFEFQVEDDPNAPGDDGEADVYGSFIVQDGGVGDLDGVANGRIVATWVVPTDNNGTGSGTPDALNATLNVTATGNGADGIFNTADDQVATGTFTDALPLTPPVQTYYVSLREDDLFKSFDTINTNAAGDLITIISVAIAADNTIIYYDHWEDGYEVDVTNPSSPGSGIEIWGDMDLSNGARPGATSAAEDVLNAGDSIVLQNVVPITRKNPDGTINGGDLFDASDRIQSTLPIAVTRAGFPTTAGSRSPGTVLAGAVELFDTDSWGTRFVAPVGEDIPGTAETAGFEYTALYIMAGEDGTVVTLPTGTTQYTQDGVDITLPSGVTTVTLDQGENLFIRVDQGDVVTSSSPVQANLVTGDINSSWETRSYSLAPEEDWSNDYYTPVGDGVEGGNGNDGPTKVWLYNPHNRDITVTFQRLVNGTLTSTAIPVAAGSSALSPAIPDNSGGRFFTTASEDTFFALTQTDASGGTDGSGRTFDWGHPLIPANQLTSQALIGLGYGNFDTSIPPAPGAPNPSRDNFSIVWATPVADADIFVDLDGDGIVDQTFDNVGALESIKITDPIDKDMTGAIIFATDIDGDLGKPVDIAVAWGQDPASTAGPGTDDQRFSLDLGTVVPALPILEAGKISTLDTDADGDGEISPGDTLLYSINIVNIGQVDLPANSFNILDFFSPVFDNATYVLDSTEYDINGDGTPDQVIPDSGVTAFPLDESGFNNTAPLVKSGNQIITFKVVIDEFSDLTPGTDRIVNQGILRLPSDTGTDNPVDEFETEDPLNFRAEIDIEKKTNGVDADTPTGPEIAEGDTVTWTYEVTNTGNVWLNNITVTDDQGVIPVGIDADGDGSILGDDPDDNDNTVVGDNILQPGETWVYEASDIAQLGQYVNEGTATGNPVYADGTTPVSGVTDPTDSDLSHYLGVPSGSIGDEIFEDVNGNNELDPGEGIEGVVVELDRDGDGIADETT
ncbi:MAG: hypothetical protein AB4060_23045, partial [Crocosphaera sp.]